MSLFRYVTFYSQFAGYPCGLSQHLAKQFFTACSTEAGVLSRISHGDTFSIVL